MSRRTALAMAETPRAAVPSDYPYAVPAAVRPSVSPPKPGQKLDRADLIALCDRVLDATADLSGPAALARAGRIIYGWVSARPSLAGSDWRLYLSRLARGLMLLAKGKGGAPFRIFGESGNTK